MMARAAPLFQPPRLSDRPTSDSPSNPPNRSDYPDEHDYLTAHIVWQHGGKDRLSPAQLEIAAAVGALMIDLRTAQAGDLIRIADVMERLMSRLPPPRSQSYVPTVTDGLTVQQIANLYSRMINDPTLG